MSHLIAPITLSLVISQITACDQKNVSCHDIKVADGYVYNCTAPVGSEIEVFHDKILIACGIESFESTPPVIRMDKRAVVTSSCLNLTFKYTIPLDEQGSTIKEECSAYVVTAARGNTENVVPAPQWFTIFGSLAAVLLLFVVALAVLFWISRKCRQRRLNELRIDLHGGNEDVEKAQDSSIDSKADDGTAEAPGVAQSPRNARAKQLNEVVQHGGSEERNAGPMADQDPNAISSTRAINRNLRDDPGGQNGTSGTDIRTIDECTSSFGDTNDEASGEQKVDHHHTERQPLLRNDDNSSGTKDNGTSVVEASGIKIQ